MKANNNDFIFIGDLHGSWEEIQNYISRYSIKEMNFVQVGDFGLGYKRDQDLDLEHLSLFLKKNGCFLYVIRGNHDNPTFFDGNYSYENIFFLKDYTVLSNDNWNILFIGGATSIDRMISQANGNLLGRPLWWKKEIFNYDEGKLNEILEGTKIDIVVTHNSPKSFYPYIFGDIVYRMAKDDKNLIQDLTKERNLIEEVYQKMLDKNIPKYWFYGHFHSSVIEEHQGVITRLLNINEFYHLK